MGDVNRNLHGVVNYLRCVFNTLQRPAERTPEPKRLGRRQIVARGEVQGRNVRRPRHTQEIQVQAGTPIVRRRHGNSNNQLNPRARPLAVLRYLVYIHSVIVSQTPRRQIKTVHPVSKQNGNDEPQPPRRRTTAACRQAPNIIAEKHDEAKAFP